jgi:Na+/proline symporter
MSRHAFFLSLILAYFVALLALAWWAGRRADNDGFFIGNRQSNWMLVAFGMVGTALSGVTFISVPGTVGTAGFSYLQVVLGNVIGYAIVAMVLLPLYYRLQLTSIYAYLDQRFGLTAHRTGAWLFIVSRTLGSTARLYLVVNVMDLLVTGPAGIPFWVSAALTLLMIWGYTFQGGVRTIVVTDTLQTTFMLGGLGVCIWYLADLLAPTGGAWALVAASGTTQVFNTDPLSAGFWAKQILGGAAIAVAMLGLDQDMMQKNISVSNVRDSQKNMAVFSAVLIVVNVAFLFLGALLWVFAQQNGLSLRGDELFPSIVMHHMPQWVQIVFFIALIAASFSSADGSLTALTSSYCMDVKGFDKRPDLDEAARRRIRLRAHLAFALLFFLLCLVFKWLGDRSIINTILVLAGYTYGPLLGLFCFGMFTDRAIRSGGALAAAVIVAPAVCWVLQKSLAANPSGYQIGIELMILNAALTFALLWLTSQGDRSHHAA